jgi:hypothetical protein
VNDDERIRRAGENEGLFRLVNERIESLNVAFAAITETMDIVCECGKLECAERVVLGVSDYERVRADPTHFVLVPGHEASDVESVIDRGDGFVVVRKHDGVPADVARETDPRG